MIKINKRRIGLSHPVYVVAEIGTNYNGDVSLALNMVKAAREAKVDAVKFQIVTADRSYTKKSDSYDIFKKIELNRKEWKEIFDFAGELRMDCFATFTNSEDLDDFADLNCPVFKISSSNLTNFSLLKAVAEKQKPVILSTGLSYLLEVEDAVEFLEKAGQKQMAILQCTSLYPTLPKDVNLKVIQTLQKKFTKYPIGFSDHTMGVACAVASVSLGATIIEKHFTLAKNFKGPEHLFSADPQEMGLMVRMVREVEQALGSSEKEPTLEEIPLREKWFRSVVALKNIAEGEALTAEMLCIKRSPRKGLDPKYFDTLLGKKVKQKILKDDPLTFEALNG